MKANSNPIEILQDPQIKTYFLGILESSLSAEEKYQKLLAFFVKESQIRQLMLRHADLIESDDPHEIDRLLSQVNLEMGIWDAQKILDQTADSIIRAIRRLRAGQHQDGGWGPRPEQSNFWGTAYAVLCLNAARSLDTLAYDVDTGALLERGLAYMERDPGVWSVDDVQPHEGKPVYEISLMVRAFYQAGPTYFSSQAGQAVARTLQRLAESQNQDGGWDAQIWGTELDKQRRVYSEVGGTSAALQALAEIPDQTRRPVVERALEWLSKTQNLDGSWNLGSCQPFMPPFTLDKEPAVNKTCDALQGLLTARAFDISLLPYEPAIHGAVEWLQTQERPIFDEKLRISGWGWGYTAVDYENTCLTLETLVAISEVSLPLLLSNAQWLIREQYKRDGDIEDGNWRQGHTARIALSLIEFYKKIETSPLFK